MCVSVCFHQRVMETLEAAETYWRRSAGICRIKLPSWRSVAAQTDSCVLVVLISNNLVCRASYGTAAWSAWTAVREETQPRVTKSTTLRRS